MNPFNRNLVFAVSTILLLTASVVEMLNMALVVLKNNFNRNIKIVCSVIFTEVKQKIKYHIKQGFEYYPRKSVISRTATDKSNPYRVNGKPIWTNIYVLQGLVEF